jgi:predicted transcriptional regulator
LEEVEGPDRLFFELSNESRLGILRELQAKGLKMQEIARQLDLTTTDAFRQMQRLSEASLVQRQPDGSYTITQYGRLVLQLSSPLEFLLKHKEYFLTHDLFCLPYQFVNRIGELSGATLSMDSMGNINDAQRMVEEAERYVWGGGGEQPLKSVGLFAYEQNPKGVKFKFLFPEKYLPDSPLPPNLAQSIEWRGLSDIPVNIVLTEKEAGISFSLIGGKADYAAFIGKDPVFLNWVKDLFLYYWEKETRI